MYPSSPQDLSLLSPLATELAATIARVVSDVALVIDPDGVVTSVAESPNAQAAGRAAWQGQPWIDTVTKGTRSKIQALLEETHAAGVSRRREVNHPGSNGDEIPMAWAAIRLGECGPVLAVGRDLRAVAAIQQRFIETQQDLERHHWNRRQAEVRYERLFQVASDGVLVLDAATFAVLDSNAAVAHLLNWSGLAVPAGPFPDSLPATAKGVVAEMFMNVCSTGRGTEARFRGLLGAGVLDMAVTPFRATSGQKLLVRVRRDADLETGSEAVSRAVHFVDHTADAVVLSDLDGKVLMANPAFVRLTRHPDEAALKGRVLTEVLSDSQGQWAALLARARSAGIAPVVDLEVIPTAGPAQEAVAMQASAFMTSDLEQACIGCVLRPRVAVLVDRAERQLLVDLIEQIGRVSLDDLLTQVAQRAERVLLESALRRAGGVSAVAAQSLGVTEDELGVRLRRHALSPQDYAAGDGDAPASFN